MKKPAPFFPESLHTLKATMGYSFQFDLRQQLLENYRDSVAEGNPSDVDEPPKYIDSITLKEFDTDSPDYLNHFTDTLKKALSGEPNTNQEMFEITRMMDNPYSLLVYFNDQTEEQKTALSLLHHAAIQDNCDSLNELASFYGPTKNHHKYKIGAYSNTKTALKLLIKASTLGSSEATKRLADIYDGSSHIKEVEPNQNKADELRELAAKQYGKEVSNKALLNKAIVVEKQAITHVKARAWYKETLESGTGRPLKHEPMDAINKYYEKALQASKQGRFISKEMATDYLKAQTRNRRPYQPDRAEVAKPMFDLGIMYQKGLNGLEVDEREASSLLFTASNYDAGIKREIETMLLESAMSNQPAETRARTMKSAGPRMG